MSHYLFGKTSIMLTLYKKIITNILLCHTKYDPILFINSCEKNNGKVALYKLGIILKKATDRIQSIIFSFFIIFSESNRFSTGSSELRKCFQSEHRNCFRRWTIIYNEDLILCKVFYGLATMNLLQYTFSLKLTTGIYIEIL